MAYGFCYRSFRFFEQWTMHGFDVAASLKVFSMVEQIFFIAVFYEQAKFAKQKISFGKEMKVFMIIKLKRCRQTNTDAG